MLDTFLPLLEAASGLSLDDPGSALERLNERFDPKSERGLALSAELERLLDAGELAKNGEMPVKWGRVTKATPESLDFSIDVVHMNGAGPRHRHPGGEVNYCIPLSGSPRFEGCQRGWVVMPPDSVHVPEVSGGEMLIVYLLPGGAMEFMK